MKKHFVNLNRIAATHKGKPLKASPLGILQEFFNYAKPAEHITAFDEFCRAALKEKYCWHRGSPANALYYSEQLELLIEAAYLLYIKPPKHPVHFKTYTTSLSVMNKEYANPSHFLTHFFSQASLKKWKTWLQAFTHAAIAKGSAADEMKAMDIYVFVESVKQLLCAAALIADACNR
jgi:hypothetical protein